MNIRKNFNSPIVDIIFAIILIGISIFMLPSTKIGNEYSFMSMLMVAPFFLVGIFLIYRNLPKTNITNKIDKFSNRIHLGLIILLGLFLAATAFVAKKSIDVESINWIGVFISIVFAFVVVKSVYTTFFKK